MPQMRYLLFSIIAGTIVGVSALILNFGGIGVAFLCGISYALAARLILTEPRILNDTTKSKRVGIWGGIGAGLVIFLTMSTSALLDSYKSAVPLGIIMFACMGIMWSFGMKYKEVLQAEDHKTTNTEMES